MTIFPKKEVCCKKSVLISLLLLAGCKLSEREEQSNSKENLIGQISNLGGGGGVHN